MTPHQNGTVNTVLKWLMGLVAAGFMFLVAASYNGIREEIATLRENVDDLTRAAVLRGDRIQGLESDLRATREDVAEIKSDLNQSLRGQNAIRAQARKIPGVSEDVQDLELQVRLLRQELAKMDPKRRR